MKDICHIIQECTFYLENNLQQEQDESAELEIMKKEIEIELHSDKIIYFLTHWKAKDKEDAVEAKILSFQNIANKNLDLAM